MTILDKIKSFFKRAKPMADVAKEKPSEVTEEKLPEATVEKPAKTTQPQKKAKAAAKKVPRPRRPKRTS